MARMLAYSSPATGHVYPLVPGLLALRERGHDGAADRPRPRRRAARAPGSTRTRWTRGSPRVEVSDHQAPEGRERLHRGLGDLLGRGEYEREDLERAIAGFGPDALIIDTNAYGAAVGAEASGLPWALSLPSLIPFPGKGIPPYGLGLGADARPARACARHAAVPHGAARVHEGDAAAAQRAAGERGAA